MNYICKKQYYILLRFYSQLTLNLTTMKKILLLLAVMVVGAISCQKNVVMNDSLNEDPTIKESTSPYAISEEEALVRLDSFMEAFDGSETRSQRRKVMHIRSQIGRAHV